MNQRATPTLSTRGPLLLLLALLFSGCSNSPTEPEDTYLISITGTIETVDGGAAIGSFQGFLDRKPFDAIHTPSGELRSSDRIAFLGHADTGPHTMEIRILGQQGPSNAYRVRGLHVLLYAPRFGGTFTVASVDLPEATQTLATGQGFWYSFSL